MIQHIWPDAVIPDYKPSSFHAGEQFNYYDCFPQPLYNLAGVLHAVFQKKWNFSEAFSMLLQILGWLHMDILFHRFHLSISVVT